MLLGQASKNILKCSLKNMNRKTLLLYIKLIISRVSIILFIDFTHYIGVICQRELFKILVGSKWQQIKQIRLHGKALQNRVSVFTLSMALHVALMFKGLEGPQNLTSITTFMIVTFMIVTFMIVLPL